MCECFLVCACVKMLCLSVLCHEFAGKLSHLFADNFCCTSAPLQFQGWTCVTTFRERDDGVCLEFELWSPCVCVLQVGMTMLMKRG